MNKIKKSAIALKKELYNDPLVKQYFYLKQLIENDEEISLLRKEISKCKKNKDDQEYTRLLNIYNSNPLVKNFYSLENEVYSLLKEVKDSIDA